MIKIVPTLPIHVEELAVTMRAPDVKEVFDASGMTPSEALLVGLAQSSVCYTALDGEGVVAIFGVSSLRKNISEQGKTGWYDEIGVPWLLASDLIEKHWYTFVKLSGVYIKEFMRGREQLTNVTAQENAKVIQWLTWCGFSFVGGVYRLGPDKTPFKQFILRNK
jgi:hypothetical protein